MNIETALTFARRARKKLAGGEIAADVDVVIEQLEEVDKRIKAQWKK